MNKYKINLHAHTIFSDGSNCPLSMAMKAKELEFTALVITDHYYPNNSKEWCSTRLDRYKLTKKACQEAKQVIPVIIGMELAFGNEEMLVFGSDIIQEILRHGENGGKLDLALLVKWKKKFDCAFILCHPSDYDNWEYLEPLLDGYERYNSAHDMFPEGREVGCLKDLPSWCNSDSHVKDSLSWAYNLVDSKIETEVDLLKYIKRRRQPEYFISKDI